MIRQRKNIIQNKINVLSTLKCPRLPRQGEAAQGLFVSRRQRRWFWLRGRLLLATWANAFPSSYYFIGKYLIFCLNCPEIAGWPSWNAHNYERAHCIIEPSKLGGSSVFILTLVPVKLINKPRSCKANISCWLLPTGIDCSSMKRSRKGPIVKRLSLELRERHLSFWECQGRMEDKRKVLKRLKTKSNIKRIMVDLDQKSIRLAS